MNIKANFKQALGHYNGGGLDLSIDVIAWSLGGFWSKKIGKATKDFRVSNVPETKDQGSSDFCVGFQDSYTVEQDYLGLILSAAFNFAATKKRYYGGDFSGFGLAIVYGLASLQHDGIPLESLYPFKGTRNRMANWRNIPQEAWADAKTRKMKNGYFHVDSFSDKFENFCAAMLNWDEMILTGLKWWTGYYIDSKGRLITNKRGGFVGHAASAIERKTIDGVPGIVFKNSYFRIREFWMSANQVRQEMYRGYIVLPIERDIAEIINKYAGKAVMSDNKSKKEVYFIMEGKRRWLENELVAWAHNVRLWETVEIVPDAVLVSIPKGDKLLANEGSNYQILKEIFALNKEKYDMFNKLIT